MFGIKSQPEQAAPASGATASAPSDLTCPPVTIRSGASTYAVGLPGQPASGTDLRYQVTIGETARECDYNTDTHQVAIKIGIQGRVIVGPAGAPPTVEVPLRIAVVEDGVSPKTIATKAYTIPVNLSGAEGAPYSFRGGRYRLSGAAGRCRRPVRVLCRVRSAGAEARALAKGQAEEIVKVATARARC